MKFRIDIKQETSEECRIERCHIIETGFVEEKVAFQSALSSAFEHTKDEDGKIMQIFISVRY
jgi:hypothetical protein